MTGRERFIDRRSLANSLMAGTPTPTKSHPALCEERRPIWSLTHKRRFTFSVLRTVPIGKECQSKRHEHWPGRGTSNTRPSTQRRRVLVGASSHVTSSRRPKAIASRSGCTARPKPPPARSLQWYFFMAEVG